MAWRFFLEKWNSLSVVSHLSFTLYVLHGPILFSGSMLIYQYLTGVGFSYPLSFVANWIVSSLIVIVVCEGYYLLIQKRIDELIKRVKMN